MVTTSEPSVAGADDPPPTPRYEPLSVRTPALVVLGLAVVILLGGVVAGALVTGNTPTFRIAHVTLADGTRVAVSPSATRLRPIEANGEPPADILGSLGVLTDSTLGRVENSDRNAAQFDRTVHLTSTLAQDQVVEAYSRLLRATGWNILFNGPAPQAGAGATELLAKHGSGDGFYWEVGIVVSPTSPTGTTAYSIELFETNDGN